MTLQVGKRVLIRTGLHGRAITSGRIQRISPTGKRVTVLLNSGITGAFYRNADGSRYVKNPGAGLFGHMLNDYIDPKN